MYEEGLRDMGFWVTLCVRNVERHGILVDVLLLGPSFY